MISPTPFSLANSSVLRLWPHHTASSAPSARNAAPLKISAARRTRDHHTPLDLGRNLTTPNSRGPVNGCGGGWASPSYNPPTDAPRAARRSRWRTIPSGGTSRGGSPCGRCASLGGGFTTTTRSTTNSDSSSSSSSSSGSSSSSSSSSSLHGAFSSQFCCNHEPDLLGVERRRSPGCERGRC
jgi:hypothetical protein